MAGDFIYYSDSATTMAWNYSGTANYATSHGDCIGVDKGSPDKAQFVIFYAIIESKDPMIFCKNKKELDKEMKKLLRREDVDNKSIRVFSLTGGIKKL